MQRIGAWRISDGQPQKINDQAHIDLEKHLEGWIARDPRLLMPGMVVLGRQVRVAAGPIDLLALDPQGRFVIIEVKRGRLRREAVAQALDYAACFADLGETELVALVDRSLSNLSHDSDPKNLRQFLHELDAADALDPATRELAIIVCGVGVSPGLERMVSYISSHADFLVNLVSFQAFDVADGATLLIRELSGPEVGPPPDQTGQLKAVLELARNYGTDKNFLKLHNAAIDSGLHARPWKTSIMYAPQENRTRCLFTVWARPSDGRLKTYLASSAFSEFYDFGKGQVEAALGPEGWRLLTDTDADYFGAEVRRLFSDDRSD